MAFLRTAALAAVACVAAAQISFTADLSSPVTPFNPVLQKCFGSGHAVLGLREDWRDHLAAVKADIGLSYLRFHGLLDDDMSVVLGSANSPTYSFANVFNVFDYMLSVGVRPIVELSFMPEALASDPSQTIFHYKGGISPPSSYTKWANLVTALVAGVVDRYGLEEVKQWGFEVWNEPNCGFWSGTQAEYFTLYNYTSRAVKAVSSELMVGGPATCQLGWFQEFYGNISSFGAPIDMFTSHLYPTDPMVNQTRTGFTDYVAQHASLAESLGLPLVMTEFNSGLGTPEGQDGPFAAAFVAHTALAIQAIPNLKILSFWTFTDVFEEGGFSSVPYHTGYGIQTYNGVPKPAYRVFQLINSILPNQVLLTTSGTVDIVVSTGATAGQVNVFLVNYNYLGLPVADQTVKVTLQNLSCTPQAITVTPVDASHSNAEPLWVSWGKPTYLNSTQITALKAASALAPYATTFTPVGASGVQFSVTLPAQGVATAVLSGCK